MATNINLPEGFTLDKPEQELPEGFSLDSGLPEGFTVDAPQQPTDEIDDFLARHPELSPFQAGIAGAGIALGTAARNFPGDALGVAKDVFEVLRPKNIIQSEQAIETVINGIASKIGPAWLVGDQAAERVVDSIWADLKDQYGSIEKINAFAIKHPARFSTDIMGIVTGLGGSVKGATRTQKALRLAQNVLDPVGGAARGVGAIAKAPSRHSIIKTALKFDPNLPVKHIDDLAQAFSKRGLRLNKGTLAVLDADMKRVGRKIQNVVTTKTNRGVLINTDDIVAAIDDLTDNFRKNNLNPDDLKQIAKERRFFVEQNGTRLTPTQLQEIKLGKNKFFTKNADQVSSVKKRFDDRIREAAKLHLENEIPGLKELNARFGQSTELKEAINLAINNFNAKSTTPTKGLIVGGVAGGLTGAVTGSGTAALTAGVTFGVSSFILAQIASDPRVQIALARTAGRVNMLAAKAGQLSGLSIPAFETGRAIRAVEQEETP